MLLFVDSICNKNDSARLRLDFLIAYPCKIRFQFSWCGQRRLHLRNITDFSRQNPGNCYTLKKKKREIRVKLLKHKGFITT